MARAVALLLFACAMAGLAASAGATQFKVGGQNGWSVPGAGAESYNTWAGRLRFQIGDQLLFVYPKETDSVLLVDAAAYNSCNTTSSVSRFDDGSTVFTFDRSGPFFFVSGNEASCRANEKLIVVVLADRSGTRTPPAAPPTVPPPMSSPPAPAPATSPSASPPSSGTAPVPAPAATPTSSPPSPAPGPTTTTPSSPPAPAPAGQTPSPSATPTPGGGASPPPSGSANPPAGSSSTTPPAPSAAAPVVSGLVGSLGAFIGYAMLAA